jgi:autotransporter family porin
VPSGYVYTWTGKASNSFGQAANWYNNTLAGTATAIPGTSDEALVVAAGTINGPGYVYELGLTGTSTGLTIGGSLNGSYVFVGGTVTLASGAELSSGNLIDIGDGSSETIAQRTPTYLDVSAGGTLFAYSGQAGGLDILIGQQGGYGVLSVSGSHAIATSGNDGFWLGDAGFGSIAVSGGGEVYGGGNTGSLPGEIGLALGTGTGGAIVTVTGSGSELAFGDIVDVGYGGVGILTVSSGATLISGDENTGLIIGDTDSTASGSVGISGASAYIYGITEIGNGGKGSLSLSNGAGYIDYSNATTGSADEWSVLVGAASGSTGTLSLASSAYITTSHGIAVGSEGNGSLSVSSASVFIDQAAGTGLTALAVGLGAGTTGSVQDSGGLIWDQNQAGIIVGGYGAGTLAISANGTVIAGNPAGDALIVGSAAGSSGTVTISGARSALYADGIVTVGAAGQGAISVTAGGTLSAGATTTLTGIAIGSDGGAGLLSVSGGNVYVSGQTSVGDSSSGTLNIGASSVFADAASGISAVVLGAESGVSGSMLVNGGGAVAGLTGGLIVGSDGTGALTVENQGLLTVSNYAGEAAPGIVVGAGSGSSGALTVESGAKMTAKTGIAVGSQGDGLLDVAGGALTITTPSGQGLSAISAGLAAGASGTIDISGGLIDDVDQAGVVLGSFGAGTLTILESSSGGGTLLTGGPGNSAGLALGVGSGSSGAVLVSGGISLLSVDGTVSDGAAGHGSIGVSLGAQLDVGAAATATALALGGVGGSGTLSLDSGTATLLGQADIGEYGAGSLSITGGSTLSVQASGFEALVVASGTAATGSVFISDSGVQLTGGLEDGDFGTASVTIEASASVTASTTSGNGFPGVVIAAGAGHSTLTVTDPGTKLADIGQFQVGGTLTTGAGTLLISAGATVTAALAQGQSIEGATIGGLTGAALSSATVTGAGSDWAIAGGLQMGGGGGASLLDVASGGTVSAASVLVDTNGASSLGTIVVTGAGSVLSTGTLTLGAGAHSALMKVNSGASVDVSGAVSDNGVLTLAGGTLTSGTAITINEGYGIGGGGVIGGAIVDLGRIDASSGKLSCLGAVSGNGSFGISAGATLALASTEAKGVGLDFEKGGGTLSVVTSADLAGTITGWSAGDYILLQTQDVVSGTYSNGTATLLGSNGVTLGTLHFAGNLSVGNFTLSHPTSSETLIAYHS